jgi:hypothetical protein
VYAPKGHEPSKKAQGSTRPAASTEAPRRAASNPTWDRLATRPSSTSGKLPAPIQAKLKVGAPDDPLEQEADAVADRVMSKPGPPAKPTPTPGGNRADPREEPIRPKRAGTGDGRSAPVPASVH